MKADDDMDSIKAKQRINQFVDWAVRILVLGCFLFIWRMYESQQDFIRKMDMTDYRIVSLEKEAANLKSEISRVEGQMVTWDTLKRVELSLELILAKVGINQKVDLTSGRLPK